MRRLLSSIKNRGLRTTGTLITIKLQSFLDVLMPWTIRGERVDLISVKYRLTKAQVERVYRWSHDEEILRWSGGAPCELTLSEFRNELRRTRWRPESDQRLFYIVTHTDELIGRVGLFAIDWGEKDGELGISILPEYWGKQYGREAIQLLAQYAFGKMAFGRIHLGTFEDNVRAQRAFAACGFRTIGTTTRYVPIDDQYRNGLEMELTQQGFQEQLAARA
jgi:RimJ/RimL family protein N-acetyltransferase